MIMTAIVGKWVFLAHAIDNSILKISAFFILTTDGRKRHQQRQIGKECQTMPMNCGFWFIINLIDRTASSLLLPLK